MLHQLTLLTYVAYIKAPDIPGIPAADPADGINYLVFLAILKNLLPGKSVSIAAPASYWYPRACVSAAVSTLQRRLTPWSWYAYFHNVWKPGTNRLIDHKSWRGIEPGCCRCQQLRTIVRDGRNRLLHRELHVHGECGTIQRTDGALHGSGRIHF